MQKYIHNSTAARLILIVFCSICQIRRYFYSFLVTIYYFCTMNNKLSIPFEFYFLPKDSPSFLKAGNTLTIIDLLGVFICTDGSIELSNDSGSYKVKSGDLFFFMPSAFVHIVNISSDFKGMVIRTNYDFIMPLVNRLLDVKEQLFLRDHPRVSLNDQQSSDIYRLMISLYDRIEMENRSDMDQRHRIILTELTKNLASVLCCEVINICLSNQPTDMKITDHNDLVFQKFIFSLNYNYRKERNVAFYAAEQCLSYSYFSAIVKSKSGNTALYWIIKAVLTDAKQMLEYTDVSIKEISDRLNFPTQSFFGKYFKQYVGISPKEYRLRARLQSGELPENNVSIKINGLVMIEMSDRQT